MVVPPSPLFAAHWSIFLPDRHDPNDRHNMEPMTGRRVHVAGDRLNGFGLEIIRGYDASKHRSVGSRRYPIGAIATSVLKDQLTNGTAAMDADSKDDDEGGGYIDNKPQDDFEMVCVEVEAPGPSLNNVSKAGAGNVSRGGRQQPRDCQWWIAQVVTELTERNMLKSLSLLEISHKTPPERIELLPKH